MKKSKRLIRIKVNGKFYRYDTGRIEEESEGYLKGSDVYNLNDALDRKIVNYIIHDFFLTEQEVTLVPVNN